MKNLVYNLFAKTGVPAFTLIRHDFLAANYMTKEGEGAFADVKYHDPEVSHP
ncbi:hypothetical protein [Fulvivirga sp. M361]|uniref:hypothetical protein n=1 Tax=Fulvivirga sp. M361 TaxID=2594266 RepID=UPI001627B98F|nr:hypothetical protein [Fulvivirga sp. M361]